ncbi:hypothetical protein B2J93_5924 [Marssonina coronariae]|uniref:Alcohol dehydrogenase-like C-terminal domain-containing protein n=1 Tax=Diplocarpon coronariae TaxID=2795749 RepID=A0A218Z976_9HELO|nr:hypothetical protein B2J93_5924 [Marssonina coronariae]
MAWVHKEELPGLVAMEGKGAGDIWHWWRLKLIQIPALFGCTVISTSSSDAKLVTAKRLEATHAVDYSTHPDWDDGVLSLTGGKRVDHVLEVGDSRTVE